MKHKTFAFSEKISTGSGKMFVLKPKKKKKKKKKKNTVDAKFFNGEKAVSRYTVTADFKIE